MSSIGRGDRNAVTTCPACGRDVPDGTFCVRCGNRLSGSGARPFAAAPHQRSTAPWIITTMYPHLPRQDLGAFRLALAIGVGIVLALGIAGLYPVAVIVAAVAVPILTVLYLYDVDLYEDEPIRVVLFTMAWGAVAGVLVGLLAEALAPAADTLAPSPPTSYVATRGIVIPILAVALTAVGPLVLLPYRKFNDVLDGATFGSAAGVAFAGALLLTQSSDLFGSGLSPVGAVGPWIVRLLELSLVIPLLYAGAIGGTTSAFWLRFRAPVTDRRALGPLGDPLVAALVALALAVAAALAQIYLSTWFALVVLIVLAATALLWLRSGIHLGLIQEAAEVPIEGDLECPNCGARTPMHTFCVNCGISLRALPKGPRTATPAPPEEARG